MVPINPKMPFIHFCPPNQNLIKKSVLCDICISSVTFNPCLTLGVYLITVKGFKTPDHTTYTVFNNLYFIDSS